MLINNLSHIITQKSIYEVFSMSNITKICIPPLNVSVTSVETIPVNIQNINSMPGTSGRLHLGKFAQQLMSIDENYCTESKPFVSCLPVPQLPQSAAPVWRAIAARAIFMRKLFASESASRVLEIITNCEQFDFYSRTGMHS